MKQSKIDVDVLSEEFDHINRTRRMWLWASSVVFTGLIMLIFLWDTLSEVPGRSVWWVVVSLMILVGINWWYWTMRVILRVLRNQKIEYVLVREIVSDIKDIKHDISYDLLKLSHLRNKK